MSNLRRASLALVPFALAFVACTEDSETTPDASSPAADAGPADATVDQVAPVVDGGREAAVAAEGGPDASDAGPPAMTLLVRAYDGSPKAGVTVVYGDANGAVLDTAVTNAQGRVTRTVIADKQVTAILGTLEYPELVTILDIKNGDNLTAVETRARASIYEQVEVTDLPMPLPSGATQYSATIGRCLSAFQQPPTTLGFSYPECLAGGRFPLLVRASGNSEVAYTYLKQNTLVVPDGGGAMSITPTNAWLTDMNAQTIALANQTATMRAVYTEIADGVGFPQVLSINPPADADAGVQSATFTSHPGYASSVQREATLRGGGAGGRVFQSIAQRSATPMAAATVTLDVAQLMPVMSTVTQDTATPARPVVTFAVSAPATGADVAVSQVRWTQNVGDAGQTSQRGSWTVFGPPTTTTVTFPALPTASAEWGPANGASFRSQPFVAVIDATFLADYDAARGQATAFTPTEEVTEGYPQVVVPPLPIDGTVRLTAATYDSD